MTKLLGLLVLGGLTWYWLDAMRTKEIAVAGGRIACDEVGVAFLDDTVALCGVRLGRDNGGQLVLVRRYRFEFTSDGSQRYRGLLTLVGKQVDQLQMEPYRIP